MDMDMYRSFLRDVCDIQIFQQFVKDNYVSPENYVPERKRFNPLLHLDEEEFKVKYRLTKESMKKVIELVRDDLESSDVNHIKPKRPQVPVDIQVMAALRFWGRKEHPLMTSYIHGVSSQTLSRICRRVSKALASNASFHIRMPTRLSEKEGAIQGFQSLAKMPNVIGAVDHHSVRFQHQMESQKTQPKLNTKSEENEIVIQVVSDAFCKIRDIDCKLWKLNSTYVNYFNETFKQTRIKERFEQNEFRGRVLLGGDRLDSTGYVLTNVDWPMSLKEKAYNQAHATTFYPVQKSLDLLKRRFSILESEICSTYNTARNIIVALAVLHNLSIDYSDTALD